MPSPETIRVISVIAFFVFFIIGLKKNVWLPVAYFILTYCKLSSYYPFLGSIKAELLFAVLILLRIIISENYQVRISPRFNSINKYLLLFFASVLLSFLFAWDRQYSWDNAVYHLIKVLILYLMVLLSIKDEQDLKIFIWSLIGVYAYLAYEPVYGFINEIGGTYQIYGVNYIAEKGPLAGHVGAANNMNQMIPIVFYLIIGAKKMKMKVLASIPMLIFIVCLIGTKSRGGVLGFLFFGICIIYFSKNRLKMGLLMGIPLLLIVAFSNLSETASRISVDSGSGRLTGLTHGIEMLKRGNIIGVGPGCFLFARGKYFTYTMESHNLFGQVIGELGVPGMIAFFFFIRQIFLNLMESKKRLKAISREDSFLFHLTMGLQISLLVRLFIGMASHSLYFFYWYVIAALSILILENVKKLEENNYAVEDNLDKEKTLIARC